MSIDADETLIKIKSIIDTINKFDCELYPEDVYEKILDIYDLIYDSFNGVQQ